MAELEEEVRNHTTNAFTNCFVGAGQLCAASDTVQSSGENQMAADDRSK